MSGFDYALLALVGLSALLGFWRGLVSELIALGAWLLAFVMAKSFMPELQPHAAQWVKEPLLQGPVTFLVILIVVLIVVALARWLLGLLVQAAGLRHPKDITAHHIVRRISDTEVRLLSNLITRMQPGALLGPLDAQHNVAARRATPSVER